MATSGRIFQQIYTRDREGIFRTNEGLDTVAKSPSLDNSFIKKVLHPFCFYNAPQELRSRGEQDLTQYPESLMMFPVETGELIIGRSIYAGSDFTGQRNTFFTHNFVIPSELKDEFIKNPAMIFGIRNFLDRYDIQDGKELPELAQLDYERHAAGSVSGKFLDQLGITETIFKQLLASIMLSIAGKKKVYIILDVNISDTSIMATKLLEILYQCLPYEMRRNYGFMTYNNEPQGKKYINVMFVEKGSIRAMDRNIDKDYLFDFPNGRIANIDAASVNSEYLDYAWRYKDEPDMLNGFFEFVEQAFNGEDDNDRLALATYYKLFALYQIEQGHEAIYESNKEAILESLNSFLNIQNVSGKTRLNKIMLMLLDKEHRLIRTEYTPTLQSIQSTINYALLADEETGARLLELWVMAIYNGWQKQDTTYTTEIYDSLMKQGNLFNDCLRFIIGQPYLENMLLDYLHTRLVKVKDAERFEQELLFWAEHLPEMLISQPFEEQVLKKIEQLFTKQAASRDSRAMYDAITRTFDAHEKLGIDKLCAELVNKLIVQTLNEIESNPTNEQELKDLKFLFIIPRAELLPNLTSRGRAHWKILHTVIQVVTRTDIQQSELVKEFEDLSSSELHKVQELMQKIYRGNVNESLYSRLIYAFYESNQDKYANDSYDQFQYDMLLEYLYINADEEGVHSFLLWSSHQSGFTIGRQVIAGYDKAIRTYFHNHDPKAFKDKQTTASLMQVRHPGMLNLFKSIKLDQSNPLIRFVARHKKGFRLTVLLTMALVLLAVVVILVWTLISAFTSDDKPEGNVVTPSPNVVTSSPDVSPLPGVSPSPNGSVSPSPPASLVPSATPTEGAGTGTGAGSGAGAGTGAGTGTSTSTGASTSTGTSTGTGAGASTSVKPSATPTPKP